MTKVTRRSDRIYRDLSLSDEQCPVVIDPPKG